MPTLARPDAKPIDQRKRVTGMTNKELFDSACAMLGRAYVPYSHFAVGACLLGEDGRTFSGCNIENASYGATICAERAAVCAAVCAGVRRVKKIAVVGAASAAWPCGICRQVLFEFGGADLEVICGNAQTGEYVVTTLGALLPNAFGPLSLGK